MEPWRQAVQRGSAAQRSPVTSPNPALVRAEEERVHVLQNMLEAKRKGTATHNGGK